MSHLRPEDQVLAAKRSCRRGRHWYGEAVNVGGGITRQVCLACGAVTIDLTGATDDAAEIEESPLAPGTGSETG